MADDEDDDFVPAPDVVVGIKPVHGHRLAEPGEARSGQVGVMWVKVGDQVLDTEALGIVDVSHRIDNGNGLVSITFICGDYRTEDFRTIEGTPSPYRDDPYGPPAR